MVNIISIDLSPFEHNNNFIVFIQYEKELIARQKKHWLKAQTLLDLLPEIISHIKSFNVSDFEIFFDVPMSYNKDFSHFIWYIKNFFNKNN